MTVNELIERLEEGAQDGFGESEIRLAIQPSWALQFEIAGVAVPSAENAGPVVYLTQGDHPRHDSPYAPGWVWAATK